MAGNRLTRRAALALLVLGGCAQVRHGALPDTQRLSVQGGQRLRAVIFEIESLDLPFHAGLIIDTPRQTAIYDPAGLWEPSDGRFRRDGQVIADVTPEIIDDYLNRAGIRYARDDWTTHVFDLPASHAVAELALERAEAVDASAPLHCAFEVSTLLSGLPGYEWIEPYRVTARLLEQLMLRDGVTYSRRDVSQAQTG